MTKNQLRYDTYCGLYCGACPVGMANEKGDEESLQKISQEMKVRREDLECRGCKSDVTAVFCTNCTMRLCAGEKGYETCTECEEYPCGDITDFRNDRAPHHSAVVSNLEKIGRHGLENWLETQGERWSCPSCGERFSWYSDTCSCGENLYSAVEEEKDLDV